MKRVFIGHRGVGKTTLLKRHEQIYSQRPHFDLDHEIEIRHQIKITDFFNHHSEDEFRKLELQTYQQIKSENKEYVIALGAGFRVNQIDLQDEVVYVSRVTDADGRIFLNRPRLDINLSALEESIQRFKTREPLFRERADLIYHMPEGAEYNNKIEENILKKDFKIQNSFYTLDQKDLKNLNQILINYSQIELRTDLIEKNEILKLIQNYSDHHWLISIRDSTKFEIKTKHQIDCDIQFIQGDLSQYAFISSHTNEISKALREIKPFEKSHHIKLCPLVENFEELKMGHDWQSLDPLNRSFLPRSHNAKWNWYRLLCKFRQKINFIRGLHEVSDQPSLFQWLSLPDALNKWGAVLGEPVYFSRSPLRHHEFFNNKNSFFTAIKLSQREFKTNLNWLIELGLQEAAVTSPLKEAAYEICHEHTEIALKLKSVNTMYLSAQKILGHNTDLEGFQALRKKHISGSESQVAVWGGGGTLAMLKNELPQADFFSSQSGQLRDQNKSIQNKYDSLIWAAPRNLNTLWPPHQMKIEKIIDLNYTETSMGLDYAEQLRATQDIQYISGLEMFQAQALKQQEFWSQK